MQNTRSNVLSYLSHVQHKQDDSIEALGDLTQVVTEDPNHEEDVRALLDKAGLSVVQFDEAELRTLYARMFKPVRDVKLVNAALQIDGKPNDEYPQFVAYLNTLKGVNEGFPRMGSFLLLGHLNTSVERYFKSSYVQSYGVGTQHVEALAEYINEAPMDRIEYEQRSLLRNVLYSSFENVFTVDELVEAGYDMPSALFLAASKRHIREKLEKEVEEAHIIWPSSQLGEIKSVLQKNLSKRELAMLHTRAHTAREEALDKDANRLRASQPLETKRQMALAKYKNRTGPLDDEAKTIMDAINLYAKTPLIEDEIGPYAKQLHALIKLL